MLYWCSECFWLFVYTDNCKEVVITGYTQAEARSLT